MTVPLQYYYQFSYYVNPIDPRDYPEGRKYAEAHKSCEQSHLERMFNTLPPFFDKNIAGAKDYFTNDPTVVDPSDPDVFDPGNVDRPDHNVKALMSCIAAHLCDVVFKQEWPTYDHPYNLLENGDGSGNKSMNIEVGPFSAKGDAQNYGVETNVGDALDELDVDTASGLWLDVWASYFLGKRRLQDEPDESVRLRIRNSLNNPLATLPSMKAILKGYLGYEPTITETMIDGIPVPSPGWHTGPQGGGPNYNDGQTKDMTRRKFRLIIDVRQTEPFAGSNFWCTDPAQELAETGSNFPDYDWNAFLAPDFPLIVPAITPDDSFCFDPNLYAAGVLRMDELRALVDTIKPSGVRAYFRAEESPVGTGYIIVP